VVLAEKDGLQRLGAFYTSNTAVSLSSLRRGLLEFLPEYMVPSIFLQVDSLPRRVNGKIDRDKLQKQLFESDCTDNSDHSIKLSTNTAAIKAAWRSVLNTNKIDESANFFDLGGDSLAILQVVHHLSSIYGIKVNARELYTYTCLDDLASYLDTRSETTPQETTNDDNRSVQSLPKRRLVDAPEQNNYIVTGGTGYLGAYLILELINSSNDIVYSLARSKSNTLARNRIIDNLGHYQQLSAEQLSRLIVIDESDDKAIGRMIKAVSGRCRGVIHSAANTSHVGNKLDFVNDNVKLTERIINLSESLSAPLYFMSTLSVSGDVGQPTKFAEGSMNIGQRFDSYYDLTKYQAENIVQKYLTNHPGAIFRIGTITAESGGQLQQNPNTNAFYNYLKSVAKLGYHGSVDRNVKKINMSPVDICAMVIIKLIDKYLLTGQTFHIYNPHLVGLDDIENQIGEITRPTITRDTGSEILRSFITNYASASNVTYDNEWTLRLLDEIGIKWSVPDSDYLHKIVDNLLKGETQ
jgi:thioester reductase-like protein/acyl carrier protein